MSPAFAIAFAITLVPLALDGLVLARRSDLVGLSSARAGCAFWGMVVATLGALPMTVLVFGLRSAERHPPGTMASAIGYFTGIGLTLLALPFIAAGQGRFRWLGLLSSVFSFVMLFVCMAFSGIATMQM